MAYLNGTEIARSLLTGEPPDHTALAVSHEPAAFEVFDVSPALLNTGSNTLAVQVHNNALQSNDSYFDLELAVPEGPAGLTSSRLDVWIPSGAYASRSPAIGAVVLPGDASLSDVVLKIDDVPQPGVAQIPDGEFLKIVKAAAGPYAVGTTHTVELSYEDSVTGPRTYRRDFEVALFTEDFDELVLGPNIDETLANDKAFTHTPPGAGRWTTRRCRRPWPIRRREWRNGKAGPSPIPGGGWPWTASGGRSSRRRAGTSRSRIPTSGATREARAR